MTPMRALAALLILMWVAACFSEHGEPAGPGGDCDVAIPQEIAGTTLLFIRDYRFDPEEVRVPAGTRVSWINCGPADAHTATSSTGDWGSSLLAPGGHYTRTFDTAGSFDYFCEPHPFMEGTIIVEQ